MAYSKARIPTEVYHLTKRENLDSILADKRIQRFGESKCYFRLDMDIQQQHAIANGSVLLL